MTAPVQEGSLQETLSFFLSKALFSEIPSHFVAGNAGFNPFRARSRDTFGLTLASTRLLALFQRAKSPSFDIVGHADLVNDIVSEVEGLWLGSRGALFFKGAYTLATHEKPAVISVLWCWHRALADLPPPRAPWKHKLSIPIIFIFV